ncbi:MAG: hypothetical protein CSB48_07240 [Proteobacteria bacterium]|nr:MAG: hypothetical protein CSB48_07240 [Pseudomonadota bacterium]PIE40172.1 MAG: hypothetical protein CSA51_02055 [Gammaproteobacteria bacterium]
MKNVALFLIAALIFWYVFIREDSVSYGPGVLAPEVPIQTKSVNGESFSFKGYTLTPLADYHLTAKVLSKESYSHDRESDLAPVDLALGWREMSDESNLARIEITQSGRWYRWRSDNLPVPRSVVERNSANTHIIPADGAVETLLKAVRKGDIVELRGKLVKVEAEDGWHWVSSLTRNDTGSGACEVMYVDSLYVKKL